MPKDTSPLDPQRRSLHAILRAHLPTFLRAHPLPAFVRDELTGYLDCGVLARACARYRCEGCGLKRVTALSCKGRGFCPRCIGRRMTAGARDLVSRVLPHVRIRQWVLSLPFALRVRLAFDHDTTLALWRLVEREIDRRYLRLARDAQLTSPRGGSLMVVHRASNDLRLNVHYHALFLDGAYDEHGRFHAAPAPTPEEIETILTRLLGRTPTLFDQSEPHLEDDELSIAHAYAAATRSERHAPDDDEHDFGVQLPTRRKARMDEWDLDAEVAVHEHDRDRLEQLCRYLLRPPLALDHLRALDDGRICIALKRPWADHTTHVTMAPDAFIARLASLVPRPRKNTLVYFGVLAANAKRRESIVPCPEAERRCRPDSSWAALMKHAFGLDVLACPRCDARLRFVAVLHERDEVRRLLEYLYLWSEPRPIHPARGPPDTHETFDFL